LASLRKDYDNYAEAKLAHDAQVELINKENKKHFPNMKMKSNLEMLEWKHRNVKENQMQTMLNV
jgi:hypothetical protein